MGKDASAVTKEAAAPEAPEMPSLKVSQLLPLAVMFGMRNLDLDEMGYRRYVELAYVLAQLLCFAALALIHTRIGALPEEGPLVKVPEVQQLGQVVEPATSISAKEYDGRKLRKEVQQAVMGFVILGGVYYKWQSLMPLVLQVVMLPVRLSETPLFELHLLGREVARPFPEPSPLGLPAVPEKVEKRD